MHQIRTHTVTAVAAVICIAGAFPIAVHAQSCPANPNGLGTSRILVVAPTDYIGSARCGIPRPSLSLTRR